MYLKLKLHTISRDGLYEASAVYEDGKVTVKKGSRINIRAGKGFKPSSEVKNKLNDTSSYGDDGVLIKDVEFTTLSTAASFVAGRTSNGMLTWKTEDGKYVRDTLKKEN